MDLIFEELKTLYQSLYVNVDDLVTGETPVSPEEWKRSEIAYDRLALISRLAHELCVHRPMRINKD